MKDNLVKIKKPHLQKSKLQCPDRDKVLDVKNLSISFKTNEKTDSAVKDLSFFVNKGETLAIVGESGAGKSVAAQSILRLLPKKGTMIKGSIIFDNKDLTKISGEILRNIRGNKISFIFQEPGAALNPLKTIDKQIGEVIDTHQSLNRSQKEKEILRLLEQVKIDNPKSRLKSYPHQLSGGQKQRVMIAMAIANRPDLLIADEPTTSLDVRIQSRVLKLIKDLQIKLDMAVIIITHDLGIVKDFANKAIVMKNGELVEEGSIDKIFYKPKKAYTKHLVSIGREIHIPKSPSSLLPLLRIEDLGVRFTLKKSIIKKRSKYLDAVNPVSFGINKGESLGIVGESGSGKSTLAMAILRLVKSRGKILFKRNRLDNLNQKELSGLRKNIQVVFQDPYNSLSPRMTIKKIIGEGLEKHFPKTKDSHDKLIEKTMEEVGLSKEMLNRYPHEFSGGERQRIAIARAIILKPDLIILDEPTSALDRSVQFQVVELLRKLQEKYFLTYIFISHDLRIVRSLCPSIIVMNKGSIVESGKTESIFSKPQSQFTKELLQASLGHI